MSVPEARVLDVTAPRQRPLFKHGYIESIRREIGPGDHVVEVGTGRGVAAVVAARQGASVVSFEGSVGQAELARRTVRHNVPHSDVVVKTAVVGSADKAAIFHVGTNSPTAKASVAEEMPIEDLPDGDVLLMDCEGAELDIIEAVGNRYGRVIAETHPSYGVDADRLERSLRERGFTTTLRRPYKPRGPSKSVVTARGFVYR